MEKFVADSLAPTQGVMKSRRVRNNTGSDQEENNELPLACNLGVFSTEDSKRHETLLNESLAAIREVREVENGYTVSFSSKNLLTIADWISLERRCCHFLSFQIGFFGGDEPLWLTLSGPKGTKEFLTTFFNAPKKPE